MKIWNELTFAESRAPWALSNTAASRYRYALARLGKLYHPNERFLRA